MTVTALRKLIEQLEQDGHGQLEVCFLCPDGFLDLIENDFVIEDSTVQFSSYAHRQHGTKAATVVDEVTG